MSVVFVLFMLYLSQSMADNGLPSNYTRQKGYCMWYGQCGINPTTKKAVNCLYNGPAKHSYTNTSRDILWRLCPEFIQNDTGVCCDEKQLESLDKGVQSAQQMMARCPACWKNFRQLYCHMTCSPDNSLFIDPKTWDEKTKGLTSIDYYVDPAFRDGLYNSCKDVIFPSDNKKIMSFLCGTTAAKCTPMKFLTFMGDPSLNNVSPFLISYPVNTTSHDGIKAMNVSIKLCNETVYEPYTKKTGAACSCQDCIKSCQPIPPYIPPHHWDIEIVGIHFDLIGFVTLLLYLAFLIVFISGSILYYNLSSKQARFEDATVHSKSQNGAKMYRPPGKLAMMGKQMDHKLKSFFTKWGTVCSKYPWVVVLFSVLFVVICAIGLIKFKVVTDPVKLWSEPGSEARQEKDTFDRNFGPFYRTAQIIFSIKPSSKYYNERTCYNTYFNKDCKLTGPIFRKEFLFKVLDVQSHLINMSVKFDNPARNSSHITLEDICTKPLSPYNENCTVISVLQYWQNDAKKLNKCIGLLGSCMTGFNNIDASWGDHLVACANNPTATNDTTSLGFPCTSLFGGPVAPNIALGGYEGQNYTDAKNLIVTIIIKNHLDDSKNEMAKAWEKKFIEYLKDYYDDDLEVAFMAERSVEDEINRESHADVYTIFVSYLIMFLYITLALGQISQCDRLMIDSKVSLAFGGILMVLASVVCSLGIFSLANEPATLIIIEVVPFLVLAVGVDNIFILVQRYQRDVPQPGETVSNQIGRVLGEIAPSMLLTSTSEAVAFAFGALSSMPAVKVFSLYAAVAVFCNFLLQLTCFVALLSLDARRQQSHRMDIFCWIRMIKVSKPSNKHSLLYQFFEAILSPALLSKFVRPAVIIFFSGLLAVSIICIPNIELGLDQSLSMPKDSYVITYFKKQSANLKVGPPVYFVLNNDKYPYQKRDFQNKVCGVSGCDNDSLTQIAYNAFRRSEQTKIGMAVSSWLDDYFSWADPSAKCCRILDYTNKTGKVIPAKKGTFCNASLTDKKIYHCHSCLAATQVGLRPNATQFNKYLPYFLKDNPEINCTKGGHAAYGDAVKLNPNGSANPVQISRFMGYHTILKISKDYVDALKSARKLAKEMSKKTDSHVFAYSIFYVYYEQYLTIVKDSWFNLLVCLASIFVMTFLLMGFHIRIAFIVTFTVAMIVTDIMGMMYMWNIPLNAVSLVNLVMAVGISVEFCSHIARHFAMTPGRDRIERAKLALAHMGSSVFSGITLTKFGGILVLAFSSSQIFEVFYFRMYLGIVLYGASHGLLFLPVFLSYLGPDSTRDEDPLHTNTSEPTSERTSLLGSNSDSSSRHYVN